MSYLRFCAASDGGEVVNGLPAWLAIIRSEEANHLFTDKGLKLVPEAEGTREVYYDGEGQVVIEVKFSITDYHWVYIIPKTREATQAIIKAARALGLNTRPLAPVDLDELDAWEREGYYHQKLDPPEEPPFCDRCFGYHSHTVACPEGDE